MIVYALAAGILVGILLTLGAGWIASRKEYSDRKQVLGSINQKLKYSGKVHRIRVRRGRKTKP